MGKGINGIVIFVSSQKPPLDDLRIERRPDGARSGRSISTKANWAASRRNENPTSYFEQ
jgi:hypothetical protein